VKSFGFRGEALSSLCAISERVQVSTCTEQEAPRGTKLVFDQYGQVVEQSMIARGRGTTVVIEGLLASLPVRRAEFKRHLKREFTRCQRWIQAYAVIASGVRIVAKHQSTTGQITTMVSTHGAKDMLSNIGSVYGVQFVKSLIKVDCTLTLPRHQDEEEAEENEEEMNQDQSKVDVSEENMQGRIKGYISATDAGSGRASGDRQLFYLNNRPVQLPKASMEIL
jgi:DNA mismatch repair protein PMS2